MRAPAISALAGAAIVLWVASTRMIDPREIGWVLHGDWQIHFLGWQFFRGEPWHWPPGLTTTFLEPIGTALGYTDSIPLVAFVLKPFAGWLPNPFQYLGLWFFVCFVLQGLFGALVTATWTERRSLQVLGAVLFIFFPPLASRIAHPALCAHWLLLWALWLNWRPRPAATRESIEHAALGFTSGLIHPYLSVMALALLLALAIRRWMESEWRAWAPALTPFACACLTLLAGWWASGLFTFSSAEDLKALDGVYSMNLLAVVNAASYSSLLSGFAVVSLSQLGEGFQYFGVGVLLLCAFALGVAVRTRAWRRTAVPLAGVLACCALYSVMPQVSIGQRVLVDFSSESALFAVFRSTGRFFWPVGYTLLAAAIGLVARDLRYRHAALVLSAALTVQLVDLHDWWLRMHNGARDANLYALDVRFVSPEWRDVLPRYERVRLYFPEFCRGPVAAPTRDAAYLASLYGLGINDGFAARVAPSRQSAACKQFGDDLARGYLDDRAVYLIAPDVLADFQARVGTAAECRMIDGVTMCVSSRSVVRGAARP